MQCNSKTLGYSKLLFFCSNGPPLAVNHAFMLSDHQPIAWSISVCCGMLDQLSIGPCVDSSTCHTGCW